jgi:hypothetical protein
VLVAGEFFVNELMKHSEALVPAISERARYLDDAQKVMEAWKEKECKYANQVAPHIEKAVFTLSTLTQSTLTHSTLTCCIDSSELVQE